MTRQYRTLDEVIVDSLRKDSKLADGYLEDSVNEFLEGGDKKSFLIALRHLVEAQGVSKLSRTSGISRDAFYKFLAPSGNPTLETIMRLLKASNYKLVIAPITK